ncbi:hypothetical protein Y032_0145g2515 [Ancylostoma ceylanicum]|uniref:Peptidase M13 N-terminal domain-containing protein n=1 Tax=Ancylostoma ceylanicum TaxID=53326 RepID=A0A016T2W7_9BILA|nr:hypothetical protein Y032_0145g2515 [Ancylostoma ceylanicum]
MFFSHINYSRSNNYLPPARAATWALHGKKQREPRWKVCTKDIMLGEMQYAVGAMYVRKAFDQASKNVTLEIIDNLLEVFYEVVLKNDWMDTKTKAMALDKAKQMLRHIAYPDFILDNKKLDAYYSGVGKILWVHLRTPYLSL